MLEESKEIVIELVLTYTMAYYGSWLLTWPWVGGGEQTSHANVKILTFFLSFWELDHFITNYKKSRGKKTNLKRVHTPLVMNTNGVYVYNIQTP